MSAVSMSEPAPHQSTPPRRNAHDAPKQRAFALAQRHSRMVRTLKIVVPVVAVLMAGGFVAASYLLTPVKVSVDTDDSAYVDGKLVMANPKLEGVTKENRAYSLNAQRAIQDLTKQDVIELEKITARLPIDTSDWAMVVTDKGTYDRSANTLSVDAPIRLTTTEGTAASLQSAFVDIAGGTLTTPHPVDIELSGGRVSADAFSVQDKGKLFVFDRNVKVTIDAGRLNQPGEDDGG